MTVVCNDFITWFLDWVSSIVPRNTLYSEAHLWCKACNYVSFVSIAAEQTDSPKACLSSFAVFIVWTVAAAFQAMCKCYGRIFGCDSKVDCKCFLFTCVNLNSLQCFSFFKVFSSVWRRSVYCDTGKDDNHIPGSKWMILHLLYFHLFCTKCCRVFMCLRVLIRSFSTWDTNSVYPHSELFV